MATLEILSIFCMIDDGDSEDEDPSHRHLKDRRTPRIALHQHCQSSFIYLFNCGSEQNTFFRLFKAKSTNDTDNIKPKSTNNTNNRFFGLFKREEFTNNRLLHKPIQLIQTHLPPPPTPKRSGSGW
eukprot:jgi/Psemu1/14371/gm1.14371_g